MVTDTSFLVALFNADDAYHPAATQQAAAAAELVVPAPVLVEFLQVVFYRTRRDAGEAKAQRTCRRTLRELTSLPAVRIEVDYRHAQTEARFLKRPKLSFPDCAAISLAIASRQEFASFDRQQLAAYARP